MLSGLMLFGTIGTFEAGWGFFQWNRAQQAARIGARIAATSPPVATALTNYTGLGNGVNVGDPMPNYSFECRGDTQGCSSGTFNSTAMNMIIFGPDGDNNCGATERLRRGLCDVYGKVAPENVVVTYAKSGLGRAGNPADPAPIITVTVTDLKFDFAVLKYFAPSALTTMPPVSVSVIAEDLKTGA